MTAGATARPGLAVFRRAFWILLCGVLPVVTLYFALAPVLSGERDAVDFHFNYYLAAEAILDGEDFYPTDGFVVRGAEDLIVDYVYPPLIALVTIPWTLLPVGIAEAAFVLLLVGVFVATLALLGVRDWRCYGLAFLWPPVTDAVTTGNVTIVLCLAAALVWRYRDRSVVAGATVGISVAAKLFLWPLVVWLAATRRQAAALWGAGVAIAAVLLSWAVVGFRGFAEYPDLVRRLTDRMDERGYTVYALAVDLGVSSPVAKALWAVLAVALLAAVVLVARRGDERAAFVLALAAAIACSPIVWLHYFALVLVAVAVVQPRLGALWFVGLPLQVFVTTGLYNGSTLQTTAVLVAAAMTFALALGAPRALRARAISLPAAARP